MRLTKREAEWLLWAIAALAILMLVSCSEDCVDEEKSVSHYVPETTWDGSSTKAVAVYTCE